MGISPGVAFTIEEEDVLVDTAVDGEVAILVLVEGGVGVRLRFGFSLFSLSLACWEVEAIETISFTTFSFRLISFVALLVSMVGALSFSMAFGPDEEVVTAAGLGLLVSPVLRILFLANSLAKISGRDLRKLCNSLTYLQRKVRKKKKHKHTQIVV